MLSRAFTPDRALRAAATAALLWLTACASDQPGQPNPDFSGERIDIRIEAGGFVAFNGQRVPLEDCMLRLRQRLRPLSKAQRQDLWVHLDEVREPDPQVQRDLARDLDRMLDELKFMGIQNVEVVL